jgi:rhodanese-related sulfurtransferase
MIQQIQASQFSEWARAPHEGAPGTLPLVLDVREPWELQTASVRPDQFTVLHVPMRDIPAKLAALRESHGEGHPIACLCHHGMRSQQVAVYLEQNGFTDVVNLQGGIDAWSRQVDPAVALY